ncbi:MAG: hypothetical protein OXT64_02310 [Gammaproteobacteria bacterium]|nr:hypothetical protein [Gammaproteobacteria bacterium]MDE0239369.1 hypothetical protein [bacterium]
MTTAERDAKEKPFDCVAFMREARSRLSEKMESMGSEAFWHWLRNKEYSNSSLPELAARARPLQKRE